MNNGSNERLFSHTQLQYFNKFLVSFFYLYECLLAVVDVCLISVSHLYNYSVPRFTQKD